MLLIKCRLNTRLAQPHTHIYVYVFRFFFAQPKMYYQWQSRQTAGFWTQDSLTKINNKLKTAGYLHCTRLQALCTSVCACVLDISGFWAYCKLVCLSNNFFNQHFFVSCCAAKLVGCLSQTRVVVCSSGKCADLCCIILWAHVCLFSCFSLMAPKVNTLPHAHITETLWFVMEVSCLAAGGQ